MIKTRRIISIAETISNKGAMKGAIIQEIKSDPRFDQRRGLAEHNLENLYKQKWIEKCLDEIEYNNLEDLLVEAGSENFVFSKGSFGIYVRYRDTGDNYLSLNKIISVGSVPVVIEIKLAQWRRRRTKTKGKKHGSWGIKESIEKNILDYKLRPMYEMFGDEFGYILVIPRDLYNSGKMRSTAAWEFLNNYGTMASYFDSTEGFREMLRKYAHRKGINVFYNRREQSKEKAYLR